MYERTCLGTADRLLERRQTLLELRELRARTAGAKPGGDLLHRPIDPLGRRPHFILQTQVAANAPSVCVCVCVRFCVYPSTVATATPVEKYPMRSLQEPAWCLIARAPDAPPEAVEAGLMVMVGAELLPLVVATAPEKRRRSKAESARESMPNYLRGRMARTDAGSRSSSLHSRAKTRTRSTGSRG